MKKNGVSLARIQTAANSCGLRPNTPLRPNAHLLLSVDEFNLR